MEKQPWEVTVIGMNDRGGFATEIENRLNQGWELKGWYFQCASTPDPDGLYYLWSAMMIRRKPKQQYV